MPATVGVIARLLSRLANHSEAEHDLSPDHVNGRESSHKHILSVLSLRPEVEF